MIGASLMVPSRRTDSQVMAAGRFSTGPPVRPVILTDAPMPPEVDFTRSIETSSLSGTVWSNVVPAYALRSGAARQGDKRATDQTACSPRKYSYVQPMRATTARHRPMMNSHQPTARPRKTTAADAAKGSGHQLWGLKKPYSPSAADIGAEGSSSGRGSSLRRVSQR